MIDNKEYARQLRNNAVKDENGIVRCSPELWEEIARIIENSEEVKHGKWKVKRDDYDTQLIKCSVCKEEFYPPDNCFDFDFLPNYCMNCGAKMDGRSESDDT